MAHDGGYILGQPDPNKHCGVYALLNLFVRCALEPPPFERVIAVSRLLYTHAPEFLGTQPVDQFMLLGELGFPFPRALGMIPPGCEARAVFPPLLDAGCALLVSFNYIFNGKPVGHSVVAETWDEHGFVALDSCPAKYEGSVYEWNHSGPEDEPDGNPVPPGCRTVVPWAHTMRPVGQLESYLVADELTGIRRDFVIAFPY